MEAEQMVGIHDRRLKEYGRRGGTAGFLSGAAVQELANDVDGLPGVFLQHLQTAFYRFQDEPDPLPRDYNWLLGVFRQHLSLIRDKCSDGYDAIQKAVDAGKLTVDVRDRNPFFGTMLENEYAYQSYYRNLVFHFRFDA